MKSISRIVRIAAVSAVVAGFSLSAIAEIDMQFWKKPGYFDSYYKDLNAVGSKIPTIKSEEQEILTQYNDLNKINEKQGLAYLAQQITPQASSALDFTLGLHYYREDDTKNAALYFKRAVDKWPTFQSAHKLLGYCALQTEDWVSAARSFSTATALGEDDARTFGLLGMIYLNQEKIVESESSYKRAIVADPDTLDWYKGLAQTLLNQGKHQEAISLFEEMIDRAEEAEDEKTFLLLQANSFIALDQALNAAANYEIVRRMGLANSDSMGRLGDIYLNENQIGLATEAYIESIELDPEQNQDVPVNSANVMVGRGYWSNGQELIETIRKVFGDALQEEHHLTLLRLEAQVAMGEQEETTVIIGFLEQILQLEPDDGQTLLLLAKFHGSEKNFEEARKYYEQAMELEDFEYKALIEYAQMLVQNKLYCDAVPLLSDALDLEYSSSVEEFMDQVDRVCRRQRLGRR